MAGRLHVNDEDLQYCVEQLRARAPDYYLSNLLMPAHAKDAANILYALHVEIGDAVLLTREPMAGEVRLQWWADIIAGRRDGEAGGHPVARSLLALLKEHPEIAQPLDAKLQAHVFDLYQDPMTDRTMLEGWCGETRSVLFQLVARIAGAELNRSLADASGHSGCSLGIIGILENTLLHRSRHQTFFPKDVLKRYELSVEEFHGEIDDRHIQCALHLAELANTHFEDARSAIGALSSDVRPLFRGLALARPYLVRMTKRPATLFEGLKPVSQLRRQWELMRGI